MDNPRRFPTLALGWFLCMAMAWQAFAVEETLPEGQALMQALMDELDRSMILQMEDLEKPYFVQYNVEDTISHRMNAQYGAIVSSTRDRSRRFFNQVRTGSYELDNTHFSEGGDFGSFPGGRQRGGGMGRFSLPLDDDYSGIRQAIWWATDSSYKTAVETLSRKRAYLKDVNLEDRPHDFTRTPPAVYSAPSARVVFDEAAWKDRLKSISGRFKEHPQIQDSSAQLFVIAGNQYIVNSEGARIRSANTQVCLSVTAEIQAGDGQRISDELIYWAETPDTLPPIEGILKDIDQLANDLSKAVNAPVLENYTGPVLFEGMASALLFRSLLSQGLAGRAEPMGGRRSRFGMMENLEKNLHQRILPKSFRVFDDPIAKQACGVPLLGHYLYDDEGVKAERVELVTGGRLQTLLMSREPTKKLAGSNGHGRRAGGSGGVAAAIGSLFVEAEDGVTDQELREALLEAARDQGLEYGLRIESIGSGEILRAPRSGGFRGRGARRFGGTGGGQMLGDPVRIYKVYVDGSREERVRCCEFAPVDSGDLKDILAAGMNPTVHNSMGGARGGSTGGSSVIAPAVLFEELELARIEQEHAKHPILKAPLAR